MRIIFKNKEVLQCRDVTTLDKENKQTIASLVASISSIGTFRIPVIHENENHEKEERFAFISGPSIQYAEFTLDEMEAFQEILVKDTTN